MKKIYVLLMLVILTIISLFLLKYIEYGKEHCDFDIEYKEKIYSMKSWYDDKENCYYVFLPSFAELEDIKIGSNKNVYINENKYENGNKLKDDIELNKKYKFAYGRHNGRIKFLKTENVSTMFIETQSGTMSKIDNKKEHKETGFMRLISDSGNVEYNGNLNYIKGRGNTTWEYQKKPYSIQLEEEANLLNIGEGLNWTLLSNFLDKSNIRNKLAYHFAKKVNLDYTPDAKYVDLYLNGEYQGLYLLAEKVEIAKNRVDIATNKYDITGPYLLEMDLEERYEQEKYGFVSNRNNAIVIKDYYIMDGNCSKYVQDMWQNLEDRIYDNKKDITKYIDLESWTSKYLIDEIFGNEDVNKSSSYFYKKPDKQSFLLYAGPIWDYDYAFGNIERFNDPNKFLVAKDNSIWKKLMENEKFETEVIIKYKEYFLPKLEELQENYIDKLAGEIKPSVELDYVRWKNIDINKQLEDENIKYVSQDYEENVKYIKDYLKQRIKFLNQEWK